MKTKTSTALLLIAIAMIAMLAAPTAAAAGTGAPRIAPPGSDAYGKSLTEWMGLYWRWYYGTAADPAPSVIGPVKLMPLPAGEYVSGSGTPDDPALYRGQLEITLRPGTPFVLPQASWIAERYDNGTPDDPMIPNDVFLEGVSPSFYIDGRLVMSDANKAAYYVPPTAFNPIVVYPAPSSYHSVAALAYQGFAVVSPPLPAGRHLIHLYEPYIIRTPIQYGVIYDNTWIITVSPQ
jgi:hypothetical protein